VSTKLFPCPPERVVQAPINTAIGLIKDGKGKALGVSLSRRDPSLPDVPTIMEQGISGFSLGLWFGMWAPAVTPQPGVKKLNAEVNRVLHLPEVKTLYATLGIDPDKRKRGGPSKSGGSSPELEKCYHFF
jgi:tripartite-type tricarboxylate transporter receptor subunit TctC